MALHSATLCPARRSHVLLLASGIERRYKSKKNIDDYDIYQTLGEGSFGRVVLAQDLNGPEDAYCAIKILSKEDLVNCEEVGGSPTRHLTYALPRTTALLGEEIINLFVISASGG